MGYIGSAALGIVLLIIGGIFAIQLLPMLVVALLDALAAVFVALAEANPWAALFAIALMVGGLILWGLKH